MHDMDVDSEPAGDGLTLPQSLAVTRQTKPRWHGGGGSKSSSLLPSLSPSMEVGFRLV